MSSSDSSAGSSFFSSSLAAPPPAAAEAPPSPAATGTAATANLLGSGERGRSVKSLCENQEAPGRRKFVMGRDQCCQVGRRHQLEPPNQHEQVLQPVKQSKIKQVGRFARQAIDAMQKREDDVVHSICPFTIHP
ncbi:coatomer subunit beta [Striga asiatica]|uniref:Coatomer subunit beta n=1 Tax=Striga asiatica TaxID=4170 RepID=A0A5A7QNB0_STRAF|nr:coatomer subunit beta [Striga asiatica]